MSTPSQSGPPTATGRQRPAGARISFHVDGETLHVVACRSLASGIGGALFCVALGGLLLVTGTKFGNTPEMRFLEAAVSIVAAVASIAISLQKEHIVLDRSSNSFAHYWDGGLHPVRTRLSGIAGPTVATWLRQELIEEHRLRFDDTGIAINTLVGHDRGDLELVAREIVTFLASARP